MKKIIRCELNKNTQNKFLGFFVLEVTAHFA